MKYATIYVPDYLKNNRLFSDFYNRYNFYVNSKYIFLKNYFIKYGIELNTQDLNINKKIIFTIYLDNIYRTSKHLNYLIVREPSIIYPSNHDINKFNHYKKIFTYNDKLIDNNRIIKYNSQCFDFKKIKIQKTINQEGYTLITSNKKSNKNGENYSLRYELIDFLNQNNFNFSIYGRGWSQYNSKNKLVESFLNRVPFLRPKQNIKNYKGEVYDKRKTGSKHLFHLSIENTKIHNGLITEKLFDSFFSNSIPIYSGPENIKDYVPEDTFINIDNFDNFNDLFSFTENLKQEQIMNYKYAREMFFNSDKIKYFDAEYNSRVLAKSILNDL